MEIDILEREVIRTMVVYREAIDSFISLKGLRSSVRESVLNTLSNACAEHRSAYLHYKELFDTLEEPRGQPIGRLPEPENIEGLYG